VYPDVFAARGLIVAMRRGSFRDAGLRRRGPLGLGTSSNRCATISRRPTCGRSIGRRRHASGADEQQYRVEQDRDIVVLLDAGRLMAAPVPGGERANDRDLTRLDAAVDASRWSGSSRRAR